MQRLLTCLIVLFLASLLSCEREPLQTSRIDIDQTNSLISEAKQYFEQKLLYKNVENARQAAQDDEKLEWRKKKQPQWDKAIRFSVDGKEVIEVPLLLDGQDPVYSLNNPAFGQKGIIEQKNGVTKALFFKHEDGTLKEYVLKLIADEAYYASNGNSYKSLSLSTLRKEFSGFVILSDWYDNPLDQYRIEKGKIVASTRNDLSGSANARAAACQPICQNVCVGMSLPCCTMSSSSTSYCCMSTYMSCYPQCFYLCVPDAPFVEPNHPPVAVYSPGSVYGKVDPGSFVFSTLNSLVKAAIVRVGLSSTTKGPVSVFFNLQVQIPLSQGGSIVNMQNMSAAAAEYATKEVLRNPDVLYTPSAQVTAGSQFRSFMEIYLQTNEGCPNCQVVNSPDNPSVPYLKWK